MNNKRLIIALVVSLSFLLVANESSVQAQIKPTIALIDSSAFHKPGGIKKLIDAIKEMGYVDCNVKIKRSRIESKIETVKKEISDLDCKKLDTSSKFEELAGLIRELQTFEAENSACMQAILKEKTEPVFAEIRRKAVEFAKVHQVKLVIGSKSDYGVPLFASFHIEDLTSEFIAYFNGTAAPEVSH
jgi:hypothetical protein